MAAEGGNIEKFLSNFCKNGLIRKDFLERCRTFLTEVKVPAKWKDGSDYRLEQVHETYKYREKVITEFVSKKELEKFKVSRETKRQFFEELERFADSAETNNTFSDLNYKSCKSRAAVSPLFGEDVKLQGVVVRKTDQNAWVLVRKGAELIVDLQTNEKGSFSKGLPPLKVGDIVEVTRFQNETETTLEPDVICCYSLSESEIKEFLGYMQKVLQENGSTTAVTEIMRCHAAWDYILQLSKDTSYNQTDIAYSVLYIIEEICSSSQMKMLPFTEQIVRQFTKSVFFKSVFPIFVENTAKEGCSSQSFKMVQSILMHVLSVSPASGPRLLPIAKVLAESLLNNSNGQAAIDFLEKLSLAIAIKVPGAHGDLEALPWREFPLLPVNEEIQRDTSGSETKDLPVIKTEGKYESKKEYLDTYFKLLREECHHKITKGISDFLNKGECDSKDVMMYRISLKDLFTQRHENSPTSMSIQLEFTHKLDSQEMIDWGNTNWLRYGNLLCISFDETFNSPVWAMLEKVEYEQSVVWVTLCHEKTNILSEAEFIMRMQEITDKGEKAYMVESQTFYLSFAPVMDILQHKEFLPFEKFLVYPEAGFKKNADYIEKISSPPDWGIIFDLPPASSDLPSASSDPPSASSDLPPPSSDLPPPSSDLPPLSCDLPPPDSSLSAPGDKPSTYSLLTEFERLKCSNIEKKLDDTQLEAVELALENKLTLIQGPPGTGKSFVGVILVRLLLSMHVGPILVVTYKNNALDHFLEMCLDLSPEAKLVRVGGRSSSDKLKDHLLVEAARVWREPLRTQKAKLTVQLQKKQDQVKEAYDKLKRSSVFSAKMFLETASESQIKELLVNSERKPMDLAEIQKLIEEKNESGLEGYVRTALEDWLPSQDEFDKFASRLSEKRSTQTLSASENSGGKSKPTSPAGSSKGKTKVDQEQENPDMKEPSTEEDERLSSTLEYELPVDDVPVTQNTSGDQSTGERKLIRIDKRRVETFRDLLAGKNLCALEQREKIHFVYALQNSYIEKASAEFLEASKANVEKHQQYELLRNKHDIDLMRGYDVIGLTVTGAAMRANLLAEIKPSVMIVEEAAEILEGQLVAVIPPSVQHLIMIGDHEQLRPLVQSKRLKVQNKLDISMFERLSNCGVPLKRLGFQARMKEELVELLQTLGIYKELKTNDQQVRDNELPDCVEKSIYFCEHTSSESTSKDYSKRNPHEAMLITDVAKTFCQKGGVDPCKITVLCAYRGQVTEIKERFKSSNVETLNKIQVTTIDSFQGQENDIILISLVRGEKKMIGFLSERNRLCVALSRARCGLYLFGNQRTLTAARVRPNHWKDIVKYMKEKDCLGRTFPFHPSFKTDENSPSKDGPVTNIKMIISNVEQLNVAIGDKARVIANSENSSSSGKTATQNIQIRSPVSEETSVQNPMSPTSPILREETGRVSKYDIEFSKGSDFVLAKEVGKPVQETPNPKKSLDLSDVEELKERPVQESFNPESSTAGTPQTENESLQRVEELSEGKPVQETEDPPSEKPKYGIEEQRDEREEQPIQETQGPGKGQGTETKRSSQVEGGEEGPEEVLEGRPLQESASSNVETECTKEEALPTQETMAAGKGPFEETGKGQGIETEMSQVKEGEEDHEEFSVRTPLQESASSNVETECTKEEALPTQETMAAGKGPFEETGKAQGIETEMSQVKEGEEDHEEFSVRAPLQESASSNVETECTKEEALPTQETMAAGKGPFEETGKAQGTETEETGHRKEGQKDHVEISEDKPLQEIANTNMETECTKEEVLPTQETMAAGKGPFEETGLEEGVKGRATSPQCLLC